MFLMKIYLNNGVIIDLNCEHYDIARNISTGKVTGYCFEKASKDIAFLDKTLIVAITAEKIRS